MIMLISKEDYKKYATYFLIVVIIFILSVYFYYYYKEKKSHYDDKELWCLNKTIKSIEYNMETKTCFSVEISSCQKPTYNSLIECKKQNKAK